MSYRVYLALLCFVGRSVYRVDGQCQSGLTIGVLLKNLLANAGPANNLNNAQIASLTANNHAQCTPDASPVTSQISAIAANSSARIDCYRQNDLASSGNQAPVATTTTFLTNLQTNINISINAVNVFLATVSGGNQCVPTTLCTALITVQGAIMSSQNFIKNYLAATGLAVAT